jgi:hypothetical protein
MVAENAEEAGWRSAYARLAWVKWAEWTTLPSARIQPKCDRLRASMRVGGEQF